MDPRDVERIEQLALRHEELRHLWEQHRRFEEELASLRAQRFLTPEEEERRRQIQKAKLVGKDRIQLILNRFG